MAAAPRGVRSRGGWGLPGRMVESWWSVHVPPRLGLAGKRPVEFLRAGLSGLGVRSSESVGVMQWWMTLRPLPEVPFIASLTYTRHPGTVTGTLSSLYQGQGWVGG